jgi:hypothetical protein
MHLQHIACTLCIRSIHALLIPVNHKNIMAYSIDHQPCGVLATGFLQKAVAVTFGHAAANVQAVGN